MLCSFFNTDCKCPLPPPAVTLVAQPARAGEEARPGGATARLVSQTLATSHSHHIPPQTASTTGTSPHSASWAFKDAAETSGVVVLEVTFDRRGCFHTEFNFLEPTIPEWAYICEQ